MAVQPFVWGPKGQQLTPDQVERLRESAEASSLRGADYSPVSHWSQGMARLVDAWGGYKGRQRADAQEDAGMSAADALVANDPVLASRLGVQPPAQNPTSVVDAMAPLPAGFPSSLIQSESGGNWNALNSEGYGGRLQFGDARLADAAAAGIIPAGITGEMFSRMSPEQQQAVEQWHFADIDRQAAGRGLNSFIGQSVAGIPITQDAIRAMAHLGGIGGAAKFLDSGGRYNPGDSNGTRLSDYASRHGGGQPATGPEALAQSPNMMPSLARASADPWVRRKYGPVIEALMQQEMQRGDMAYQQQLREQDPAYQLGLQKSQMEIDAMRNPAPPDPFTLSPGQVRYDGMGNPIAQVDAAPDQTSAMQNFQFLVAQGMDPQAALDRAFNSGVTVNNNMATDKFAEAFAKGDADTLASISDAGIAAQRNLSRIKQLDALLKASPSGFAAAAAQRAGEWGIKTEGLDTVQAAQALINSLIPEQRQPGSGDMSNTDLELFKQSLPRLINQPGGNQLIIDTMRAVARYDAEGAQIVQQLRAGSIDRATAFQMLQDRQNPLAQFSAPAAPAQQASGGGSDENLLRKYGIQ